uniref:ABC transporter ATP-binding protein n=1 Tax=Leptospirillum ferriphilum TaxID=178606 RepID=A0A7C3QUW7_9BACT
MNRGMSVVTRNLVKNYPMGTGEVSVLKGISLEIAAGELVALTGESGAGKSTLLHILGTVDRSSAGTVLIGEKDLETEPERVRANFRNRSIGFIFQFHHLLPEFTALENVLVPAWIEGSPEGATRQRGRYLLQRMGLAHRMNHRPAELSGGEQQRVAIARALLQEPALVLADEPTGNLDTHTSLEVFALLKELNREEGMTVILATHNLSLASLSDRVIHMKDGVIGEGESGALPPHAG